MTVFLRTLAVIIALALAGGAVYLVTWDIPPPSATKEIVLPNDRFPD